MRARQIRLVLLIAVGGATVPGVRAQTLWGATTHGMTVEQVRAVVPAAASPSKPELLGNGARELLRLDELQVLNLHFRASFYFLSGQLVEVMLSLKNPGTFDVAQTAYETLREALRRKYGPELSQKLERAPLNQAQATWASGRTDITLFEMSVGHNEAVLNVVYQVRLATAADTL